jgi:hypothetical protein
MIRRDVRLDDGSPGWALISQIEHARISAQLAELCLGRFDDPTLSNVRTEILAAIAGHDDGWAEWERTPRLHEEPRRPVSFMELEPPEALAIWSTSIERAAALGPLAGWMVAGHFCRLLDLHASSAKREAAARQWYVAMQRRRDQWLSDWQAIAPAQHSRELADEALRWLWTFDEISLWFCCRCPSEGDLAPVRRPGVTAGRGTAIEMELRSPPGDDVRPASGAAIALPWRFRPDAIDVTAATCIVSATPFEDFAAMLAAGTLRTLRWQLKRSAAPA